MYDRKQYNLADPQFKDELLTFFKPDEKLIIFDIGGCEGEESIRYSRLFPNSSIYIFEPLPKNGALIQNNLKKYRVSNVEFNPIALSDISGTQQFHVSSGHPNGQPINLDWDFGNKSSSLLPPERHPEITPWLKFSETINVQTDTLFRFMDQKKIVKIDFLHMDVQGAELKVLQGARDMIEKIKAISLEVSDIELYKGQPKRIDIEAFMARSNFFLCKSVLKGGIGDQFYVNRSFFKKRTFFFIQWYDKILKH